MLFSIGNTAISSSLFSWLLSQNPITPLLVFHFSLSLLCLFKILLNNPISVPSVGAVRLKHHRGWHWPFRDLIVYIPPNFIMLGRVIREANILKPWAKPFCNHYWMSFTIAIERFLKYSDRNCISCCHFWKVLIAFVPFLLDWGFRWEEFCLKDWKHTLFVRWLSIILLARLVVCNYSL